MSADIHSLAGAYALHALTDEEERQFRRHLAMCADCAVEVAEYERTAAVLGAAAEEEPPVDMRAAVLGAVDATPQVRDGVVAPAGLRRRLAPVLMPVAAGLALMVMALGGVVLQQRQALQDTRLAQAAQTDALLDVLGAADLQRIAMRGDGSATVLWAPGQAQAVLVAQGLSALPEGKAYQLWLMRDGVPVPSQVFTPGPDGRVVALLSATPAAFQAAAVTVEDASGATSPTGPMVLTPA